MTTASTSTLTATNIDPYAAVHDTALGQRMLDQGKRLVVLTAFKAYCGASGKYKDGRVYEVGADLDMYQVHELVRDLIPSIDEHNELFWTASVPGHPCDHPRLFAPRFVQNASRIVFDTKDDDAKGLAAGALKSYGQYRSDDGSVSIISRNLTADTLAKDLAASLRA